MAAFRGVLDAPPSKVFDRESWSYWHVKFGLEAPQMPDSFFAVYPWFKDRTMNVQRPLTAELPSRPLGYPTTGVVRPRHEMQPIS